MRNVSTYVLWILVVVYAVVKLVNPVFPLHIPIPLVLLIPIVFGLVHGALRYKWSGILTFIVICLVVSNILENTSILNYPSLTISSTIKREVEHFQFFHKQGILTVVHLIFFCSPPPVTTH